MGHSTLMERSPHDFMEEKYANYPFKCLIEACFATRLLLLHRLMSGREDDDVFWESWASPGKKKRKKSSRKLKSGRDDAAAAAAAAANTSQKKKKNDKRCGEFKEAPAKEKGRKEKKKKEKKKKRSMDTCVCRLGAAAARTHVAAASPPPPPHATKKPTKKKKTVAFDLSPVCVGFPEFASSPPPPPRDGGGRSEARWAELSQSQPPHHDDEENSQDLFITQKTFRASPSAVSPTLQLLITEEEEEEEAGKTAPGLATPPEPPRASQGRPRYLRAHKPRPLTASAATQTDNFFTSQFSSFIGFCQRRRLMASRHDDDRPLDLSVRRGGGGGGGGSPRSPPSAEATASSEDNEPPGRASKPDLSQVRAVQMRLNESFFFKTKGDGLSPRAESPLMKLSQGRAERKSRKSH